MITARRRRNIGLTALVTAVSTLALALPAEAVTPPDWPTSGHLPQGPNCEMTGSITTPPNYDMRWADTSVVSIEDVRLNGGTTLVLPPAGGTMTWTARAIARCGGVRYVIALPIKNEGDYSAYLMEPATTNVFDGVWKYSKAVTIADIGVYRMGEMNTVRRYDSFITRSDLTLISKVDNSDDKYVAGPWSLTKMYVLRATTLSNALSAAKVKKGKTVKATATLKMAAATGYVPAAGAKVSVQTKVGSRKWVTNATLTASSSGVVTYSFVLSATTSVRFVHATTRSGNLTNGVTSAIKVVKRKR
jgi:hypothetical protein